MVCPDTCQGWQLVWCVKYTCNPSINCNYAVPAAADCDMHAPGRTVADKDELEELETPLRRQHLEQQRGEP